jgi:glucoamylase
MDLRLSENPPGPRRAERRRLRAAMIGTGALVGGIGLALAARRLIPRLEFAPGWPGVKPHWAPADKQGVGTAVGPEGLASSPIWFTLGHGAITEVYHPRADSPRTRDLSLIVADGRGYVSDECRDAEHEVESLADGVPAYRLINTCKRRHYRIEKTIIAHPHQAAVLQHTRFTPLRGTLDDYRLFAVLDPHLGLRKGVAASGWVGEHKGRTMLLAERGDCALALAIAPDWADGSVGYAGTISDGRRDVLRHGRLTRHYRRAPRGNVLLTGEIDLRRGGGEFVLALGFGLDPGEAAHRALAGVRDDFEALVARYVADWRAWQEPLLRLEEVEPGPRDLYRTSTMALRVHSGKSIPGAIVASLATPWGPAFGDERKGPGRGGYHMVWPRDQGQAAGAMLASGARAEARAALEFLRDAQEEDGHWPQNMWASGATYWSGIQLGETAMPILLADLLHRQGALDDAELDGYWPMVRAAAGYILRAGPATQEERWENARGYNPYTLGALIAALLVAAEMAERRGEGRAAAFLRESADAWYSSIDHWTYVEDTRLARRVGVPGYYLRVAPPDEGGEPVKADDPHGLDRKVLIRGEYAPAQVVSPDALAYVRFGLRAADDPRITDTIKVIDTILKTETPFGPCWHRYNHDYYGERADGSPFSGKDGHGRCWPLLSGERAHYELTAGRRDEAIRLLRAVERFAGDGGLIPEQVWDAPDVPEHELYFGRPSGSAMPLAWAHAEYVKLRRSLRDGRVFDLPPQTVRRYLVDRVESPRVVWRVDHRRGAMPAGKVLRVELTGPAVVRWGTDGREAPTVDSGLGVHYADLTTEGLPPGASVRFTIAWEESGQPSKKPTHAPSSSVVRIEGGGPAGRVPSKISRDGANISRGLGV